MTFTIRSDIQSSILLSLIHRNIAYKISSLPGTFISPKIFKLKSKDSRIYTNDSYNLKLIADRAEYQKFVPATVAKTLPFLIKEQILDDKLYEKKKNQISRWYKCS